MLVDFLAIGIDNYFDAVGRVVTDKNLKYAASDADKMHSVLTSLFDIRHASLLADGPQSNVSPTRNAILKKLYNLGVTDPDDRTTLFVYFAGHGIGIDGVLHLCPSDYDSEIREYSSLSLSLLCDLISKRRGRKCLVLDCCRATLSSPAAVGTPRLSRVSVPLGDELVILISCSDGQSSYEVDYLPRFGGGVFTHEIIRALAAEASSNAGAYFNLGNVFRSARDGTVQYVYDNLGSVRQTPIAFGGDINEFMLESKIAALRDVD